MTRRDYILITDVLRRARPKPNGIKWLMWDLIRMRLGDAFEKENPTFNRDQYEMATLSDLY